MREWVDSTLRSLVADKKVLEETQTGQSISLPYEIQVCSSVH